MVFITSGWQILRTTIRINSISHRRICWQHRHLFEDWFCLQLAKSFFLWPQKKHKRLKALCPWQLHPFPKYVFGITESTEFLLCLALYSCKWFYINLQRQNSPSIAWFNSSNFYRNSLLIIVTVIFPSGIGCLLVILQLTVYAKYRRRDSKKNEVALWLMYP